MAAGPIAEVIGARAKRSTNRRAHARLLITNKRLIGREGNTFFRATGAGFVALPRRAGLAGEPRERCSSAATATRLIEMPFVSGGRWGLTPQKESDLSRGEVLLVSPSRCLLVPYVGYRINGSFDNRDSKGQFFAETLTTL